MTWLRPLRSIDSLSLGIIAHILRLLRRTRCTNTMFCHTQLILCVACNQSGSCVNSHLFCLWLILSYGSDKLVERKTSKQNIKKHILFSIYFT